MKAESVSMWLLAQKFNNAAGEGSNERLDLANRNGLKY